MKSGAKKTVARKPDRDVAQLIAEQSKSLEHIALAVANGFKATHASLTRLERRFDTHAEATAADFSELAGELADLTDAIDRLRDTTLRNDRVLGDLEFAVDKIDRRSEADVKDLLQRVAVLETAIKRSPHAAAPASAQP